MKKLILISSLLLGSPFVLAEERLPPSFEHHQPPSIEQRIEHMSALLSLTEDQVSLITEILNGQEPLRQELEKQLKALHEQEKTAINSVLSDEQLQTLHIFMQASRPGMPNAQPPNASNTSRE